MEDKFSSAKAMEDKYALLMYFVYILQSLKDNTKYVGLTINIKKRIKDHNNGKSKYTKGHMPWKLIWCCIFYNKTKAGKFEKYLKSGSGTSFMNNHLV